MKELRWDLFWGEWVILSPERATRPNEFLKPSKCPFCPGNEDLTPGEVFSLKDEKGQWRVRVVPNLYPAVEECEGEPVDLGEFSFRACGVHEVIVESPKHEVDIDEMEREEVLDILKVYRERYASLKKRYPFVFIFRNYGPKAGASRPHPHSQLIALSETPPRILYLNERLRKQKEIYGVCPFCKLLREELEKDERVVFKGKHFLAFVPFAPRFSYEVWIIPLRHNPMMEEAKEEELGEFASIYQKTVSAIKKLLNFPSYNVVFHNFSTGLDADSFHWHCQIIPRLATLAGFELGAGVYINPSSPEEAAKSLREAL